MKVQKSEASRAALYIRVSTTEQAEEGYSLDAQRRRLIAYCESQGWIIADVYVEAGVSAKDTNRPELQRMLADMVRRLFDIVLTVKLDRLTRSVRDCDELLKLFEKHKVSYQSASESFETRTATGRMMINIVSTFAQFEREQLGERTKAGQMEKARGGEWAAGYYPYGYDRDGSLIEEKAEEIKDIRRLYVEEKLGLRSIAVQVNKTSTRNWNAKEVSRILRNPFYAGIIKYDSVVAPGKHAPIWSKEEYEHHLSLIDSRATHGRSRRTDFWFTGVLRCGGCGGPMSAKTIKSRAKKDGSRDVAVYYLCLKRNNSNGCDFPFFRQVHIEHLLMEYIDGVQIERSKVDSQKTEKRKPNLSEKEVAKLERELEAITARRVKWQRAFASDAISIEDLRDRRAEEDAAENSVRARLSSLVDAQELDSAAESKLLGTLFEGWGDAKDLEKQKLVRAMFKRIELQTDCRNVSGSRVKFFPASLSVTYN